MIKIEVKKCQNGDWGSPVNFIPDIEREVFKFWKVYLGMWGSPDFESFSEEVGDFLSRLGIFWAFVNSILSILPSWNSSIEKSLKINFLFFLLSDLKSTRNINSFVHCKLFKKLFYPFKNEILYWFSWIFLPFQIYPRGRVGDFTYPLSFIPWPRDYCWIIDINGSSYFS